jgi:hypothetical protein
VRRCSCRWALQPIHLFVRLGSKRQPTVYPKPLGASTPVARLTLLWKIKRFLWIDQSTTIGCFFWIPL